MADAPMTLGCFTQAGGTWGEWLIYLNSFNGGGGGFQIPAHNEFNVTYYGSTNNIQTITYRMNTTVVATQTLTYVGGGIANDDLIATSTVTYP